MNFAVSKPSFSLKPMTAHVLSTLVFLMAGSSAFGIASAQTTSEDLWVVPPVSTQGSKPQPDTLPYCEDLQQPATIPNGSTVVQARDRLTLIADADHFREVKGALIRLCEERLNADE